MSNPVSTDAQIGFGAVVAYQIKPAAGVTNNTFLPIATLTDLEGPEMTVGKAEKTRLSDGTKRYMPTRSEPGEPTFNLQHVSGDPAVQAFRNAIKTPPIPYMTFQLTYADGGVDTFDGFVTGYKVSGLKGEEVVTAAMTVQIDGAIRSTYPTGS